MNYSDDDYDDYREFFIPEDYDGTFKDYYRITMAKFSDFYGFPPFEIVLSITIIHLCICAVGYVGNIITCIVIARNKSMHTTTNVYLFNLAIADLIMMTSGLLNFTLTSWYPYRMHKVYGLKGCFIATWFSDTAVNVSSMTIMAFTIERYLAICRPFLARIILSIPKAVKLILLIWIIGTIFGYLMGSQQKQTFLMYESMCSHSHAIPYIVELESIFFFVLPFVLMAVLYILIGKKLIESTKIKKNQGSTKNGEGVAETPSDDHSNRQIFKMLVTVVAVFFICWAPFHFRRLFRIHRQELLPNPFSEDVDFIESVISQIFVITYYLSSAINPVIYSVMSNKFRGAFKKVFKCNDNCWQKQMAKIKTKHRSIETTV